MAGRESAFLGVDIGSSELRAGLVTADGRLLGLARSGHAMSVDAARGVAEQDPEAWWVGLVRAVRQLTGGTAIQVAGIAVDGHGPTLTAVDATGRPTRSAITWLDRRAGIEQTELAAATGLEGWALGVLPGALWTERHDREAADRTRWYLNTWEALALRLCGVARTSLVAGQPWPQPSLLEEQGIPPRMVAPPIAAGEVLGALTAAAARDLGLAVGTPVVAGVVDAFASFHGAGMVRAGDAIDVGGSAGGFGVYWDQPVSAAGSYTTRAPIPDLFVVGGAMAATGRALDWLRDAVLAGDRSTDALIQEAAAVEPGANGLVFLPYLAGERSPIWDPDARGAFIGLTLDHGRAHLARAVLEATALAVRHVAEPIIASGVRVRAMRVAGGPAHSDHWNQIKADVTGLPVEVPSVLETAVVGSAILAASGTGAHAGLGDAVAAMTSVVRRLEPNPAVGAVYDRAYAAYTALHPALAPILRELRAPEPRAVAETVG